MAQGERTIAESGLGRPRLLKFAGHGTRGESGTENSGDLQGSLLSVQLNTDQHMCIRKLPEDKNKNKTKQKSRRSEMTVPALTESAEKCLFSAARLKNLTVCRALSIVHRRSCCHGGK